MRKEYILERQLKKCQYKEGDWIKWRSSRGEKSGYISRLLTDVNNMTWHGGTQPYFIEVRSQLSQEVDGAMVNYGTETTTIPLKKVRNWS